MKEKWKLVIVPVILSIAVSAAAAAFTAHVTTERRLSFLEGTVTVIQQQVQDIHQHLLGE